MCLTHGRCGTEYIFSALRKITSCGHEIFNIPLVKKYDWGKKLRIEDVVGNIPLSIETIEKYLIHSNIPKIQFYQIHKELLDEIMNNYSCIIYISRRDLFIKTISALVGNQTTFHIKKDEEEYIYPKVYIQPDTFKFCYEKSLIYKEYMMNYIRDTPNNILTFYYEDIPNEFNNVCRKILDFAGYNEKVETFTTDFKKREVDYSEIVINYNELKELI